MESPRKYTGYDSEGKIVQIAYSENANNYISPASVQTKINSVNSIMNDYITQIQKALRDIESDTGKAVIVNNTNMSSQVNELVEALETFKDSPKKGLESVYTQSVKSHDNIQGQLNEKTKNKLYNTKDVVKVM